MKLEAKHIQKSFENTPVLQDVSIQLDAGEFVSILGLSGSGKSTLFNIIAGLLKPDGGQVFLDGQDVTGRTGLVSYMYQKDLLMPWRTVLDNVALPLELKGEKKREAREKAAQYFPLFGLSGFEKKYPFQLSGGMRQRAALMRTYLFQSDVMLLDEPFGGLDAITREKMHFWLMEVLSRLGASVLFITHDIGEAVFLSDRLYLLGERPAVVRSEVSVELPRPRTRELLLSDEYHHLKNKVSQQFTVELQ